MNTRAHRTSRLPGMQSRVTPLPLRLPPPGVDPVEDPNYPVFGWPMLAKMIAEKPELEAFPSFMDLNIKSLLYYQAELTGLRKELHEAEYKDYRTTGGEQSSRFHKDLSVLLFSRDLPEEKQERQWVIMEKIRKILDKYNAALLQFSEMSALREANNCNVKSLQECVKRIASPGCLIGDGAQSWGGTDEVTTEPKPLRTLLWGLFTGFFNDPDAERELVPEVFQEQLIVPRKGPSPDGLTLWVIHSFVPFYDRLKKDKLVPFWKKYLLPILTLLVSIWNGLGWLLLGAVRLWRFLFPCKLRRTDEEKSSNSPAPSGYGSSQQTTAASSTPPSPRSTTSSRTAVTAGTAGTDETKPPENTLEKSVIGYSGAWILGVTSIMTTVVACLLPTVAITILARVHSMGLILGLIAIFTAIFAVGLVLLSSTSSRVEIFTATAAFSAVMVVFVQNQVGHQ